MNRAAIILVTLISLFMFGCEKDRAKVSAAAAATQESDTKVVKDLPFGIQGPETGSLSGIGMQVVYGAQLAANEINSSGGINGKPIRLINYDSRGDKTEALYASIRLTNKDKVCAIIGEPTSGGVIAVRKIIDNSKTVAISPGATADGVTIEIDIEGKKIENFSYIFRNTLLDKDGVPVTIKFLLDNRNWRNYVIITSTDNDYSVGLSELFRNAIIANNGKVVSEESITDQDTDVSQQVQRLRGKVFDAVIFTGYYSSAANILLEMRKQGINAPMLGGDGLLLPELFQLAKDAAIGTVAFSGFADGSDSQIVKDFNRKIKAAGHESEMYAAQAYDAFYLLANAAKAANVTDCSDPSQRIAMRNALAATRNFQGVSGVTNFDADNNAVKIPFIQEIAKNPNGSYYFKLLN